MAFVGISQKLISDVRNVCNRMCAAELNTVGDVGNVKLTEHDHWYKELCYGKHLHLMQTIPQEWTRIYRGYGNFHVSEGERHYSIGTQASDSIPGMPPNHNDYGAFTVSIDDPRLPEEVKLMVHKIRERKEIEQRWNSVRSKVCDFLDSCKSLNEAIKLWPEVEHYLPKEYIERLLQKREKSANQSRAAEVLDSIDTQELTAAVVIARMAGVTA